MRLSLLLTLTAVLLCGCSGYQLGPIKPKLMREVKTIAVNNFKNDTLEPRVEVLLADAVIKQIQQDGTYKVTDEKDADATLECSLDQIQRSPSRSVRGNVLQTKEFILTLRVRYTVMDKSGKQLDARTVIGQTSFFVSGSGSLSSDVNQDERQAIPLAAQDLAVRLVSQISEGW